MIQRIYEQASKALKLDKLIVATDDERIEAHINHFGGRVMMTSGDHRNGTERCGEVISRLSQQYDFVINIQGDEPFISPIQIDLLAGSLEQQNQLATLVKHETDETYFNNLNTIKVVFTKNHQALYFSRSPIPKFKISEDFSGFHKHIGIYAYRTDVLKEINALSPSPLELSESLEQLRWLENGYQIKVFETEVDSHSIDSPEDLERVLASHQMLSQ